MIRWPSRTSIPVVSVSSTISRILHCPSAQYLIHTPVGQRIGQVVFLMPAVPLDPAPFHLMLIDQGVQLLPEVGILSRLASSGVPAAYLPLRHPVADSLHDRFRVRGQYQP